MQRALKQVRRNKGAPCKTGVRIGEYTEATTMGVLQGGPLSQVLANVVGDELATGNCANVV